MNSKVPHPLKAEHAALHETLWRAMRDPGAVGEAPKTVATTLHGHFEREESFALPPLGLLNDPAHVCSTRRCGRS